MLADERHVGKHLPRAPGLALLPPPPPLPATLPEVLLLLLLLLRGLLLLLRGRARTAAAAAVGIAIVDPVRRAGGVAFVTTSHVAVARAASAATIGVSLVRPPGCARRRNGRCGRPGLRSWHRAAADAHVLALDSHAPPWR